MDCFASVCFFRCLALLSSSLLFFFFHIPLVFPTFCPLFIYPHSSCMHFILSINFQPISFYSTSYCKYSFYSSTYSIILPFISRCPLSFFRFLRSFPSSTSTLNLRISSLLSFYLSFLHVFVLLNFSSFSLLFVPL